MKGKNWLLALTLFWCGATLAGYTLDGTYRKLSPQYPDIVPIRLQPEDGVRHWPDQVYREVGNRELAMDIFMPEGASAPRPGLLLVHGGGWGTGDRSLLSPPRPGPGGARLRHRHCQLPPIWRGPLSRADRRPARRSTTWMPARRRYWP